jgi:cobalamin biosynthesis protein CobD/CbiB
MGNERVFAGSMKKLLELLVCIVHPVAVILMLVNLASRKDLNSTEKLAWGLFGLIPLVPFLYVLTGGSLW